MKHNNKISISHSTQLIQYNVLYLFNLYYIQYYITNYTCNFMTWFPLQSIYILFMCLIIVV
jgi:hypothetical protein